MSEKYASCKQKKQILNTIYALFYVQKVTQHRSVQSPTGDKQSFTEICNTNISYWKKKDSKDAAI